MRDATHYEALGVSRTASQAAIERAWRLEIRRNHPDLLPPENRKQASARAAQINEAREVLVDPARRRRYDLLLQREQPRFALASESATTALGRLRHQRRLDRVRVWAAVTTGAAAVAYTIRAFKVM